MHNAKNQTETETKYAYNICVRLIHNLYTRIYI